MSTERDRDTFGCAVSFFFFFFERETIIVDDSNSFLPRGTVFNVVEGTRDR